MIGSMDCDILVVSVREGTPRATVLAGLLREKGYQVMTQTDAREDGIQYKSLVLVMTENLLSATFVHKQMRRCRYEKKPFSIVYEVDPRYGGVRTSDKGPIYGMYMKKLPEDLHPMLRPRYSVPLSFWEPRSTSMIERILVLNRLPRMGIDGKTAKQKVPVKDLKYDSRWNNWRFGCLAFIILLAVLIPTLVLLLTYHRPVTYPTTPKPTKVPTLAPTSSPVSKPTTAPTQEPTFAPVASLQTICNGKTRKITDTFTYVANFPGSNQTAHPVSDPDTVVGFEVRMVGGGGGGSSNGTLQSFGGPSAYLSASFSYFAGDQISLEVGRGGIPNSQDPTFPDGGMGSSGGASAGGSSRVYIGNILVAVVGAGGGAGLPLFDSCPSQTPANGGAGGARVGSPGRMCAEFFENGNPIINGGSQTVAGPGGSKLKGADAPAPVFENGTFVSGSLGCGGGGGGWMGGGTGKLVSGGGGGSSYLFPDGRFRAFDPISVGNTNDPIVPDSSGYVFPPSVRSNISLIEKQPYLGSSKLGGPGGNGVIEIKFFACV